MTVAERVVMWLPLPETAEVTLASPLAVQGKRTVTVVYQYVR